MSKSIKLSVAALLVDFKIGNLLHEIGDLCIVDYANNKLLTHSGLIDIKASEYRLIKQEDTYAKYTRVEAGGTDTKSVARKTKKPKSNGDSKVVRSPEKLGSTSNKKRSKPVSKGARKGKDWGLRGE
jgi:hypothetical protein